SHDLWAGADRRFAGMLPVTGMHQLHRRLERFGPDDLARQVWLLRASLTTLAAGMEEAAPAGYHLAENGAAVDPQRLLAAACAVGDQLAEQAIHGAHGDASWIGLTAGQDEQWALLPLGMDFYDGLPGVALFLAYLGAAAGEERYT